MLDSGHCWRGALSQEASALPWGRGQRHPHHPLALPVLLQRGAAPQRMLLHQSQGKHRGRLEQWDARQLSLT